MRIEWENWPAEHFTASYALLVIRNLQYVVTVCLCRTHVDIYTQWPELVPRPRHDYGDLTSPDWVINKTILPLTLPDLPGTLQYSIVGELFELYSSWLEECIEYHLVWHLHLTIKSQYIVQYYLSVSSPVMIKQFWKEEDSSRVSSCFLTSLSLLTVWDEVVQVVVGTDTHTYATYGHCWASRRAGWPVSRQPAGHGESRMLGRSQQTGQPQVLSFSVSCPTLGRTHNYYGEWGRAYGEWGHTTGAGSEDM